MAALGAIISFLTRNVELKEPTQDRGVQLLPGNYICLEVADTGKGIEPDILPRVFEPFFTTKRNHRGLGLAWVYGIVVIALGIATCYFFPFSIPLLIFWIKPEVKAYMNCPK